MKKPLPLLVTTVLLLVGFTAPVLAKDEAPKATAKADSKKGKAASITTVDEAIELAKKENKMVFIQVGREACGNCQALKKAIKSGQYRLSNKFIHVELSCDDAKVMGEFRKRFKVDGGTLPFVAITDGEGNDLANGGGFLSKQQFDDLLEKAKKAAKPAKKP